MSNPIPTSNLPPQLHLSLQTNTTSFKRSFDQFGFDLESPVNGPGEGASARNNTHDRKRARSTGTFSEEEDESDTSTSSGASGSSGGSSSSRTMGSESNSSTSSPGRGDAVNEPVGAPQTATMGQSHGPPRLPTPEIRDIEMPAYVAPHGEEAEPVQQVFSALSFQLARPTSPLPLSLSSPIARPPPSPTALALPLPLPLPLPSTLASLPLPLELELESAQTAEERFRLSLEGFNTFDSHIDVLRHPSRSSHSHSASPSPSHSHRSSLNINRIPTPPPTLPPLSIALEDEDQPRNVPPNISLSFLAGEPITPLEVDVLFGSERGGERDSPSSTRVQSPTTVRDNSVYEEPIHAASSSTAAPTSASTTFRYRDSLPPSLPLPAGIASLPLPLLLHHPGSASSRSSSHHRSSSDSGARRRSAIDVDDGHEAEVAEEAEEEEEDEVEMMQRFRARLSGALEGLRPQSPLVPGLVSNEHQHQQQPLETRREGIMEPYNVVRWTEADLVDGEEDDSDEDSVRVIDRRVEDEDDMDEEDDEDDEDESMTFERIGSGAGTHVLDLNLNGGGANDHRPPTLPPIPSIDPDIEDLLAPPSNSSHLRSHSHLHPQQSHHHPFVNHTHSLQDHPLPSPILRDLHGYMEPWSVGSSSSSSQRQHQHQHESTTSATEPRTTTPPTPPGWSLPDSLAAYLNSANANPLPSPESMQRRSDGLTFSDRRRLHPHHPHLHLHNHLQPHNHNHMNNQGHTRGSSEGVGVGRGAISGVGAGAGPSSTSMSTGPTNSSPGMASFRDAEIRLRELEREDERLWGSDIDNNTNSSSSIGNRPWTNLLPYPPPPSLSSFGSFRRLSNGPPTVSVNLPHERERENRPRSPRDAASNSSLNNTIPAPADGADVAGGWPVNVPWGSGSGSVPSPAHPSIPLPGERDGWTVSFGASAARLSDAPDVGWPDAGGDGNAGGWGRDTTESGGQREGQGQGRVGGQGHEHEHGLQEQEASTSVGDQWAAARARARAIERARERRRRASGAAAEEGDDAMDVDDEDENTNNGMIGRNGDDPQALEDPSSDGSEEGEDTEMPDTGGDDWVPAYFRSRSRPSLNLSTSGSRSSLDRLSNRPSFERLERLGHRASLGIAGRPGADERSRDFATRIRNIEEYARRRRPGSQQRRSSSGSGSQPTSGAASMSAASTSSRLSTAPYLPLPPLPNPTLEIATRADDEEMDEDQDVFARLRALQHRWSAPGIPQPTSATSDRHSLLDRLGMPDLSSDVVRSSSLVDRTGSIPDRTSIVDRLRAAHNVTLSQSGSHARPRPPQPHLHIHHHHHHHHAHPPHSQPQTPTAAQPQSSFTPSASQLQPQLSPVSSSQHQLRSVSQPLTHFALPQAHLQRTHHLLGLDIVPSRASDEASAGHTSTQTYSGSTSNNPPNNNTSTTNLEPPYQHLPSFIHDFPLSYRLGYGLYDPTGRSLQAPTSNESDLVLPHLEPPPQRTATQSASAGRIRTFFGLEPPSLPAPDFGMAFDAGGSGSGLVGAGAFGGSTGASASANGASQTSGNSTSSRPRDPASLPMFSWRADALRHATRLRGHSPTRSAPHLSWHSPAATGSGASPHVPLTNPLMEPSAFPSIIPARTDDSDPWMVVDEPGAGPYSISPPSPPHGVHERRMAPRRRGLSQPSGPGTGGSATSSTTNRPTSSDAGASRSVRPVEMHHAHALNSARESVRHIGSISGHSARDVREVSPARRSLGTFSRDLEPFYEDVEWLPPLSSFSHGSGPHVRQPESTTATAGGSTLSGSPTSRQTADNGTGNAHQLEVNSYRPGPFRNTLEQLMQPRRSSMPQVSAPPSIPPLPFEDRPTNAQMRNQSNIPVPLPPPVTTPLEMFEFYPMHVPPSTSTSQPPQASQAIDSEEDDEDDPTEFINRLRRDRERGFSFASARASASLRRNQSASEAQNAHSHSHPHSSNPSAAEQRRRSILHNYITQQVRVESSRVEETENRWSVSPVSSSTTTGQTSGIGAMRPDGTNFYQRQRAIIQERHQRMQQHIADFSRRRSGTTETSSAEPVIPPPAPQYRRRARFARVIPETYFHTHRLRPGALGDFVLDDEFDDSYEGLLSLAATLGDAKPKKTPNDILDKLEKGKFKEWKTTDTDTRCPICLDDYSDEDQVLKLNNCSHWLHNDCLQQWLQTANTCPVCRKSVHDTASSAAGPSSARRRHHLHFRSTFRPGPPGPPGPPPPPSGGAGAAGNGSGSGESIRFLSMFER